MMTRFPRKPALLLMFLVCLIGSITIMSAQAQVMGPPQPEPKPTTSPSKFVDSVKNFFKPKTEESTPPPATGDQPQTSAPSAATPPAMLVQPPLNNANIAPAQVDPDNPPVMNHPKLDDPNNALGLAVADTKMQHITSLVNSKHFAEAKSQLTPMRQWLIDATEAHISLYKTLTNVSSAHAQAELEKQLALEFAKQRDQAFLDMGQIYINEKDNAKAIKELVQVVQSQPRSPLGIRSYELLQEIGFTEKLQLAQ